jgi:nucleotide-binding universal stress UspA family protein
LGPTLKELVMTSFIKNILWATDFSDEAQEALLYADHFARALKAGLTAVHVVPEFSQALYDASAAVKLELEKRVQTARKEAEDKIQAMAKEKRIKFEKIIIKEGTVSKKIIETSEQEKAGLIVIGKKGHSAMEKVFMGSVTNQVLRSSAVPVLVTKKKTGRPQVKRILVPTDFSKQEEVEQDMAFELAKGFGASMTLLYVLELFGHDFRLVDEMFDSVLQRLKQKKRKEKENVRITEEVYRAVTAASGIVDYAETQKFDLIVMSTYVHKIERFLLGSTTEKVISHSHIPVFAIPPSHHAE